MAYPAKNISKPESSLAATKPKPSMKAYLELSEVICWRMVIEAYKRAYSYLDSSLIKEGQSCARFQIFFHLYFEGPHSASELARKQAVTRGNISMFLKRLLAEKLIVSIAAPESKKRRVYAMSKKGRVEFERLFPRHVKRVQSIVPEFSAEKLEFLNGLAEMAKKAKNAV